MAVRVNKPVRRDAPLPTLRVIAFDRNQRRAAVQDAFGDTFRYALMRPGHTAAKSPRKACPMSCGVNSNPGCKANDRPYNPARHDVQRDGETTRAVRTTVTQSSVTLSYLASIVRASAGVAALSPSSSMILTAFSTSAALLGASSPLPRY